MLATAPTPKPEEHTSAKVSINPGQWERLPVSQKLIGRVIQIQMFHEFFGGYGTFRGELREITRHPGGNVTLKFQTTAACFPDLSPGATLPANLPWREMEETCCRGFAGGVDVLKLSVTQSGITTAANRVEAANVFGDMKL